MLKKAGAIVKRQLAIGIESNEEIGSLDHLKMIRY